MADGIAARLTLDEVRASVKRMQAEGERIVGRIRKDAGELVSRSRNNPVEVLSEARDRARGVVRTLQARRSRLRSLVLDQLSGISDRALRTIGAASSQEVLDLSRRVAELERRVQALSEHRAA